MRKSDYPKKLPRREQYTAGEIAAIFGVSHRTACKYIDAGTIKGFTFPGSQRRHVLLADLEKFVADNPKFSFVLDKIESPEN